MPAGSPITRTASSSIEAVAGTTEADPAPESRSVRVVVFNDHPVFRSALSWKLGDDTGIRVIADSPSLHETLSLVGGLSHDAVHAVIADLRIGDGNSEGIESVRTLVSTLGSIPIIVCSDMYSSSFAARMREAGAAATVQKSASIDDCVAAIHSAVSNARSETAQPPQANGVSAA